MTNPSAHTPSAEQLSRSQSRNRSNNAGANLPSRPTTPLRPPSRTSLRTSQTTPGSAGALVGASAGNGPLQALEPVFAELSDSMADLEANMMHLQLLNESLGRFNENFGAFLYGMNMSAFCVDFPEAPMPASFARHKDSTPNNLANSPFHERTTGPEITDATFLTTDTSFVENPPTSSKPSSKYSSIPPSTTRTTRQTIGRGSGVGRSTRGRGGGAASGIARGTNARGARAGVSGIARGIPRGRSAK